jgi:hypothetical protein
MRDLTGSDYPDSIRTLREHGVTHVLDVREEWNDLDTWVDEGLPLDNYCYAPIVDSWGYRPDESWCEKVETFVRRFLDERKPGDRLLIHCHMGINRAPSAAMLALLVADPSMNPFDAFLAVRNARDIAGVIYAEWIGRRHITKHLDGEGEMEFRRAIHRYWTPALRKKVRNGIAYYRGAEGSTVVVDSRDNQAAIIKSLKKTLLGG